MLFVHILRRWTADRDEHGASWILGLRDPEIAAAISLLDEDPARPWTVEELAHRVGVSRATLSRRFTDLVGESPLAYLTRWRLELAGRRLRDGSDTRCRPWPEASATPRCRPSPGLHPSIGNTAESPPQRPSTAVSGPGPAHPSEPGTEARQGPAPPFRCGCTRRACPTRRHVELVRRQARTCRDAGRQGSVGR
ncbi:helix-turn-helix domain-containing protein [Streptomyces sp. NPDC101160]|uniref:helix-turn-helix domain-containing protein n=1 Tax=Streptomyces sp. NPDC101160 TaxID=3366118 RepID=UPI003823AEA0